MMKPDIINILRCPIDGGELRLSADGAWLIQASARRRYPIVNGIAMLVPEQAQALSEEEQEHD